MRSKSLTSVTEPIGTVRAARMTTVMPERSSLERLSRHAITAVRSSSAVTSRPLKQILPSEMRTSLRCGADSEEVAAEGASGAGEDSRVVKLQSIIIPTTTGDGSTKPPQGMAMRFRSCHHNESVLGE